jgi:hypothetical protein
MPIVSPYEIDSLIGGDSLRLPVIFLDDIRAPRVLGREGIFNNFMIIFDEKEYRSAFIKHDEPETATIRDVLNA